MNKLIQAIAVILTAVVIIYGLTWVISRTIDMIPMDEATKKVETVTDDLSIIRIAAERNGIKYGSKNWYILLAIRRAENGPLGKEFGIMNPKANNLDKQAGWCAASIVKSRARWFKSGKPEDFITFMGRRYCPPNAHPLNKNWVSNVTFWKDELARIESK